MVFSSLVFLFSFLPFVLVGNWLLGTNIKGKNLFLLIASLFFYAWGEGEKVVLMLISILINYLIGLAIDKWREQKRKTKMYLVLGIVLNLGILFYFKYAHFFSVNINLLLEQLGIPTLSVAESTLPIGISFYTFQAMSYIIDVYNNKAHVQKRFTDLGLYIAFFPQLIAGPIVRYNEIAKQINWRKEKIDHMAWGIRRFIVGLAKKVIIANGLGEMVDQVFGSSPEMYSSGVAWVAIVAYAIQLYFDFSGYSDMAIGLGRVFGFRIPENFNFPYSALSIRDFWHRWHITLSRWFRDYLYFPLGGNRISPARTYFNLIVVFFITGLWHGASWNFVIWGLFHGLFLIFERAGGHKFLLRLPRVVQRFYTLTIVLSAWVFFRSPDLSYSVDFFGTLFSPHEATLFLKDIIDAKTLIILLAGILLSFSVKATYEGMFFLSGRYRILKDILLFVLFLLCVVALVNSTYNPFIYFRF